MYRLRFTMVCLLIAVSWGPASPAAERLRLAHTAGRDCLACHAQTPRHLTRAAGRSCTACHAQQIASATEILEDPPRSADDAPLPKAQEQGPGMSLPMYYAEARRGPQPNEMVTVPAGPFTMGTGERMSDEGPPHTVRLKAFQIDRFEVTNLQYKAFIDASHRRSPEHFSNRSFPEGKADHPVTFVTWYDAQAYCAWAAKRLPSDKEWEKAARGTDRRRYPWGDDFDLDKVNSPVRWATLKLEGDTTPVGAFEGGKSPYGVYDMSGNVWEWTDSWYQAYPGNRKKTENYGEKYKTLKGGSWWDCSFYRCGISAPVYNRAFFLRNTKNGSFGFRCARDGA